MRTEKINDNSLTVKLPKIKTLNLPFHPNLGITPYMLSGFFGERGSGKTTLCSYLISLIGKYQQKIYWFSSTVKHDEKVIKMLEPLGDKVVYIDTFDKNTLELVLDEIKEENDKYIKFLKICEKLHSIYKKVGEKNYEKYAEKYFISLLETGKLDLEEDDMDYTHDIDDLPKQLQFTIVVDDELSNPLLMSRTSKDNEFLKMVIKHRHYPYHINVMLLLQNFSSLSNVIRRNIQEFFVSSKITDNNLLKFIFNEVGQLFNNDFQQFLDTIKLISNEPHSFMFINKNNKEIRSNLNTKIIM